jgi:hypothetical protein
MNQRSQRNIFQRNSIARFNISFITADQNISNIDLRRSDNISFFTITIIEQSDSSRSVGVIFDCGNLGRYISLVTAKIYYSIFTFIPPPINRDVILPWQLRPPVLFKGFNRLFTGSEEVISAKSETL